MSGSVSLNAIATLPPSYASGDKIVMFRPGTGPSIDTLYSLSPTLLGAPIASISALRAATTTSLTNSVVTALGYTTISDGGEGPFAYVSTDTSSADNGGTIIVDASNRRWYRMGASGSALNLRWFGAMPNGSDVTTKVQSVYNLLLTTGGSVYWPGGAGSYVISATILVPSNVLSYGDGPTSLIVASAAWQTTTAAGYAMFANANTAVAQANLASIPATTYDSNITFEKLSFSYVNLQLVGPGGTHAIRCYGVKNIRAIQCNFAYGNDGTAYVGCDTTLVQGCTANFMENAAYDHWCGTTNARVIGNFASTLVNSGVCVLLNGSQGGGADAHNAGPMEIVGNVFHGGIGFDTLATNCTVNDLTIADNYIEGIVYGRGTVTGTKIIGNTISAGAPRNAPGYVVIWVDQGGGAGFPGNPSNTIISDNTILNAYTTSGNEAAIRVYGTALVSNNIMTSSGYTCALLLAGGGTQIQYGNTFAPGTVVTTQPLITMPSFTVDASGDVSATSYAGTGFAVDSSGHITGASVAVPNAGSYGWKDAAGHTAVMVLQADNNFIFYGTNPDGSQHVIFTVPMSSSSPSFGLNTPLTIAGNFTATGGSVTATTGLSSTGFAVDTSGNASALSLALPNAGSVSWKDASSHTVNMTMQADNNFVFYGTHSGGSQFSIFNVTMESSVAPIFNLNVPLNICGAGTILSAGTGVPSSSTPGSAYPGSQFNRSDGSVGARIYIAQGSGSWTAIPGV